MFPLQKHIKNRFGLCVAYECDFVARSLFSLKLHLKEKRPAFQVSQIN